MTLDRVSHLMAAETDTLLSYHPAVPVQVGCCSPTSPVGTSANQVMGRLAWWSCATCCSSTTLDLEHTNPLSILPRQIHCQMLHGLLTTHNGLHSTAEAGPPLGRHAFVPATLSFQLRIVPPQPESCAQWAAQLANSLRRPGVPWRACPMKIRVGSATATAPS